MVTATKPKKCGAKDPSTCRYHGKPQTKTFVNQITTPKVTPAQQDIQYAGPVGDALKSNLVWEGEQPSWWKEYVHQTETDEVNPTTPKLVDVIDSPAGKLAVLWQETSQERPDRSASTDSGMQVNICYFKSFETGETIGYLKATTMNERSLKRSFGDDEFYAFRFHCRYGGGSAYHYGLKGTDAPTDPTEIRKKIWLNAHKELESSVINKEGKRVSTYSLTENDIPDDEAVKKDLQKLRKKLHETEIDSKVKYFETPFVDYSSIKDPLKGKGFGASIYVYTARILGQRGQVLRGSGVQSDDAQSIWKRFQQKLPGHVGTINLDYHGQKSKAYVLDYR